MGGTEGYIFLLTNPSVTNERKTVESIFSDIEGIVLYSSLKRITPFSCSFNKTTKAHLSPNHSNIGDAEQYS
ncbi:hypothetical protein K180097E11_29530 [Phocaeicola dorei]